MIDKSNDRAERRSDCQGLGRRDDAERRGKERSTRGPSDWFFR